MSAGKKLYSVLSVLLLIMLSCGNTYAYKPDSSLEARIKSCVVKIIRYNRSGDPVGTGTGFFVAPTKVITNRHVVAGGYSAAIQSLEREVFPVQGVAAYDELLDLVLLEVDVPLRKFDYLDTGTIIPFKGDRVIVIGNPWGRGPKTTTGVVTDIQEWEFVGKVIEYDAPTFPGNSGSPVMNAEGELIGLAFDGNWEALTGDWQYDYDIQRTIAVDIRYVLFIVDKIAKSSYILSELDF